VVLEDGWGRRERFGIPLAHPQKREDGNTR